MNCHYSCTSCSAPVYMFKCLTCPSTRQLIDSTCQCISGYYDSQQPTCYQSSETDYLTEMLLPIATGYFYANIALFWLYAIILFCRVNSPKIRMTLNFAQIIALLKYYPFIYEQISKQFINSLTPLNFVYFSTFFTCDTNSTVCVLFQYIWQPLLLLPCLIVVLFIGYLLTNVCYKNQFGQSLSVKNFWLSNWFFMVFIFFDFTAVIYGYNLTKTVLYSYWGFIFLVVYFIILIAIIVKFFRIINNEEQDKIIYRGRHSWAFGYDQQYHLYFIDFLYTQASKQKPQIKQKALPTTLNLSNLLQTKLNIPTKPSSNTDQQKISMFVPHSNLYLFQLVLKLLVASSTALLYEYKPTFIVIPLILLINIIACWMGVFFYYQKSSLFIYGLMSAAVILSVSIYWTQYFWLVAIAVSSVVIGIIGGTLIGLFFSNKKIKGKLIKKMYEQQQIEQISNKQKERQQISQQQLLIRNEKNSRNQKQKLQSVGQQNLNNAIKFQPFSGNLTRKTRPKPNQINNIIQQEDNNKQGFEKANKKINNIFNDSMQQQSNQQGNIKQNVIRPSSYQSKLSDVKSKISARNKTKNQFEDLDKSQQQQKQPQTNLQNNNQKEKEKEKQKLSSKYSLKNRTTRNISGKIKNQDELLSNVLEQPAQENQNQQQFMKKNIE